MTLEQEIYQDIVVGCDLVIDLLERLSHPGDNVASSLISHCRKLRERAARGSARLLTDNYGHMISRISSDRNLEYLASSPDRYDQEIDIHLHRLIYVSRGEPLLKPAYHPYAIRCIDALIRLLEHAARPLDELERGSIGELTRLREGLIDGRINPPLMYYLPVYKNLREVYRISESSIDDLPNGKSLMKTVTELIFEGVRPMSWVTPEAADEATRQFST
jgi:hypothetical protein